MRPELVAKEIAPESRFEQASRSRIVFVSNHTYVSGRITGRLQRIDGGVSMSRRIIHCYNSFMRHIITPSVLAGLSARLHTKIVYPIAAAADNYGRKRPVVQFAS